jgi:hypothetical protein
MRASIWEVRVIYLIYLTPFSPEGKTFADTGLADPDSPAGLDEGLLPFSLSNLLYTENPYSYKKCQ